MAAWIWGQQGVFGYRIGHFLEVGDFKRGCEAGLQLVPLGYGKLCGEAVHSMTCLSSLQGMGPALYLFYYIPILVANDDRVHALNSCIILSSLFFNPHLRTCPLILERGEWSGREKLLVASHTYRSWGQNLQPRLVA